MTDTTVIQAAERELKTRISFTVAVKNSFTLAYRAWLKMLHNPESFMEMTILPVMLTLLFTFLFGGAVSGSTADYLPVIIPGVLVMCCAMGCSTAGTLLREDMNKGITKRLTSMPIARISPVAGMLMIEIIRYTVIGVVVFSLGFALGYRPEAGIVGVMGCIGLMVIAAWCLSWVFALMSVSVKSISTAQTIGMVIMFPMAFLSNALVPVETMPGWLQWVVDINPLSHVVTAMRELLSTGAMGSEFLVALAGSLVILAVFAPMTVMAYKRRA
ncbi:MAG: ABC transporter permease [Candidatus Methanoplasma sp.]|nr:ABC transporter permease [Candidatus Methanoplasma sp.]